MGVNATFTADFSTFLSAINDANVKLADFGKGAETVETKLNNMVDKFSGRALIQQANEMVVAIDKIGGATALTETEQAKLNATLTEAIAKYHAIGEDVPPGMQKLADDTKQVATTTEDLFGSLKDLAGAFGIAFSVDALVNFGKELFNDAVTLRNLSLQTHISIEDLQGLTAATEDYGVSGEELSRALFQLQQRIGGGDASVIKAFADMGVSFEELKTKSPVDLLVTMERGLASMSGAAQDAAAKDLVGGKLGSSMVALSGNIDEAVEKMHTFNKASADAVKAMAEDATAIDEMWKGIKSAITEGVGGSLLGLEALQKAHAQGASNIKIFAAGYMDWLNSVTGMGTGTEHLAKLFDDLNQKTEANTKKQQANTQAHQEAATALDKQAAYESNLKTIRDSANVSLTAWQTSALETLDKIGQMTTANAAKIGITAEQIEKYKKGLEDAKKATEDLAKAEAEADAIALNSYNKRIKNLETLTQATLKAYSFEGQISQLNALSAAEENLARSVYDQITSEKDRMKVIEDLTAKRAAIQTQEAAIQQKHAGVVNDQVIAELDAQAKLLAAYGENADGTQKMTDANTKLQVALDALHAKKVEGISQYNQEQVLMDQFLKDSEAETAAVEKTAKAHQDNTKAVAANADAVAALHGQYTALVTDTQLPSFFGNMTGYASVASTILAGGQYTAGEAAYIASGHVISGSIGGGILARAEGGPVSAGAAYLVGEQGPELFVPKTAGTIAPNGGGPTVVFQNTFHMVDTESNLVRRVGDQLTRQILQGVKVTSA